jgi:hypothetical protein
VRRETDSSHIYINGFCLLQSLFNPLNSEREKERERRGEERRGEERRGEEKRREEKMGGSVRHGTAQATGVTERR